MQLRYFVAAAESESYRVAADDVGVDQALLWKHVQNFQSALDLALFERVGRRVRLTAAGRDLLVYAQAVVAAAQALEKHADDLRDGSVGTVGLSCFPVHITFLFADVISGFHGAFPGIEVDLTRVRDNRQAGGRSPFDDLAAGEIDLAVGPSRREEFDGMKLYDVRYVAVVPEDHAWRRLTRLDASALQEHPLLLTPKGNRSRDQIERACAAAGFRPWVRAQSGSAAALLALGQTGVGIPIVADDNLPRTPRALFPVVAGESGDLGDEIWMHWRRGTPLSPQVAMFVDYIRSVIGSGGARSFGSLAAYRNAVDSPTFAASPSKAPKAPAP